MNSRSDMRRLAAQAPDKLIQEIERLREENKRHIVIQKAVTAINQSLLDSESKLVGLLREARERLKEECYCAYIDAEVVECDCCTIRKRIDEALGENKD